MGPVGGSPGPIQGIGGAGFTLTVNTQQFNQGLQQAQGAAQQASQAIGQSLGKGGGAAMGLMQLGNAVDDIQYGFRAIVNNIPGIVMGLGGGAGVAGAVGIAAVAVNQLINHWDDLKSTFGDLQVFRDAAAFMKEAFGEGNDPGRFRGIGGAVDKGAGPGELPGGLGAIGKIMEWWEGGEGKRAIAAAKSADVAAGQKLFEKADSAVVDKEKAADFAKALEEAGGMKKVLGDTLKEAMKAPGANEDEQKGRIAKIFAAGARGDEFNPDALGKPFAKAFDAQEGRRVEKRAAEGEEEAKRAREAQKKVVDALNKQGEQLEQQTRNEQLQGEADALRSRAKGLTQMAQDKGQSEIFQGTRAFSEKIMQAGLDSPAQKQLEEAKRLNDKADKIIEELKNQKKMAVFG